MHAQLLNENIRKEFAGQEVQLEADPMHVVQ